MARSTPKPPAAVRAVTAVAAAVLFGVGLASAQPASAAPAAAQQSSAAQHPPPSSRPPPVRPLT